jgi:hypothetical protein
VEHTVYLFADQDPRLGIALGVIGCREPVAQAEGQMLIR